MPESANARTTPARSEIEQRVDAIDALLPQTQCGSCGFPGCRPYATAIATRGTPIDRCAPGGDAGVRRLAALLSQAAATLDPAFGPQPPRRRARIVDASCIGCAKCIAACPVDAIAGASKWLHAIVPELCTGCALCVPPCPMDCIVLEPLPQAPAWSDADAAAARARYQRRKTRLARLSAARERRLRANALRPAAQPPATAAPVPSAMPATAATASDPDAAARRQAAIAAALERARQRLAQRP
ncbi:MAG TPA: RnfABCDGE type electron transport complex subunit B [Burkholderiaceae bacterium]|nr:RnfABCDGE type electron transport complex subunit B [Burkholderiaceae bacterium]